MILFDWLHTKQALTFNGNVKVAIKAFFNITNTAYVAGQNMLADNSIRFQVNPHQIVKLQGAQNNVATPVRVVITGNKGHAAGGN